MTTVPVVVDALVARFSSATALVRVRVLDGPWFERPSEDDVLVVGWLPDEGPSVEFVENIAGLGSSQESYDVMLLVSAWRGGASMRAARKRADELVEAVRGVLVADPTLGGAVTRARVTGLSLSQFQTSKGAECAAEITVHVDAFRTP